MGNDGQKIISNHRVGFFLFPPSSGLICVLLVQRDKGVDKHLPA